MLRYEKMCSIVSSLSMYTGARGVSTAGRGVSTADATGVSMLGMGGVLMDDLEGDNGTSDKVCKGKQIYFTLEFCDNYIHVCLILIVCLRVRGLQLCGGGGGLNKGWVPNSTYAENGLTHLSDFI